LQGVVTLCWPEIALIAVTAAVAAAAVAVFLDRARATRRHQPAPARDPPTDPAPGRLAPATDTIPVQLLLACLEGAAPPRRGRATLTTQPREGIAGAPHPDPVDLLRASTCGAQPRPLPAAEPAGLSGQPQAEAIRTRRRTCPQPANPAHAKRGESRCTRPTSPQLNRTALDRIPQVSDAARCRGDIRAVQF
jgi:hypothetical protein